MRCSDALGTLTVLVVTAAGSLPALGAQSIPGGEPESTPATLGIERQIGAPAGPPRTGDTLEVATESLARELRCPVCQGMSVADSPSSSALAMRAEIADLLAAGYSPDQITEYFVNTYGEFVLLDPRPEGLNWVLWLAPVTVFALGLGWVAARSRGRAAVSENGETDEGLDSYLERVRAEVGNGSGPTDGEAEERVQPER